MDNERPLGSDTLIFPSFPDTVGARRSARQRSIASAACSLLAHVGTPALPTTLLTHACALLGAQRGSLYAVNPVGETVIAVTVGSDDLAQPDSALDETRLAVHLLQQTLPLIVDCANDDQARQRFCAGGDCPLVIGVPLQWEGRQIGVIHLTRTVGNLRLDADDLGVLSQLAELAAAALARHLALATVAVTGGGGAALRLTQALREAASQSGQISASLAASLAAVDHDRRRIAGELHDGVRQSLLGAQLQLEAARADLAGVDASAGIHAITLAQHTLADADAEMSRIVQALRPPILAEAGLRAALRDLGLRWGNAANIRVTFDLEPDRLALPELSAMALYRIAQEAISNVVRHAHASSVQLSLHATDMEVTLMIADDGRGAAAPRGGGVGLFSMSERAQSIGAQLQIDTPPGQGTRISVIAPLESDALQEG
ncbi:MAG: sensor histidine kinase [Chloroflexales bacterium]